MEKKRRIVIDARMLGQHGIGRYVAELAAGLAAEARRYEVSYLISPELPPDSPLRSLPHTESRIPFLHPLEPLTLYDELKRLDPDLYHSPSFSSLVRYPCPHVQTVHDLNHFRYGGLLERIYYRALLFPSARSARVLVTVSDSARRELAAWLNLDPREIRLARNAIEERPSGDASRLDRFGLKPGAYFLAVSNPKPHKNLALLERAYLRARTADPELPPLVLNIAGDEASGVRKLGELAALDLNALLSHARAFFFPSLYEGFGRPPLEAALAGTVPYVSDIPPHREGLAGIQEAHFLHPEREEEWVRAFREAKKPERVGESGKNWIREAYSLKKLADAMDAIYREALSL